MAERGVIHSRSPCRFDVCVLPHVQPCQHTSWSRGRLCPSILSGTQTGLLHRKQLRPLRSIKNWCTDGGGGKLQPTEETRGRNPCVITTVIAAGSDSSFLQDSGTILRHRVVRQRHGANGESSGKAAVSTTYTPFGQACLLEGPSSGSINHLAVNPLSMCRCCNKGKEGTQLNTKQIRCSCARTASDTLSSDHRCWAALSVMDKILE